MNLERMSALVDGELDATTRESALDQIGADPELRGAWMRYHLISDALHGTLASDAGASLADRVRDAVREEPAVLAAPRPERPRESLWRYAGGVALAASVAMVAVLGLRGLDAERGAGPDLLAGQTAGGATPVATEPRLAGMRWDVDRPDLEAKLNSYLVNHSAYTGSGVYVMKPYVRVVGYHAGP